MSIRNVFLGLGMLLAVAGLLMTVAWFNRIQPSRDTIEAEKSAAPTRSMILVASRTIPMGTLLRPEDVTWKETLPGKIRRGYFVQGQAQETDYVGAITRREVANGEALTANDILKVNDQRFLAATLTPGSRAVSLSFEGAQSQTGVTSASALVLPGDHVDVILTQNLEAAGYAGRRLVAETVLHDLRVVAVDRMIGASPPPPKTTTEEAKASVRTEGAAAPKIVTLEASERQAQELFVAAQLGKLHLSVRPMIDPGRSDAEDRREDGRMIVSTWAADVSPALQELTPKAVSPAGGGAGGGPGGGVESSIRYAPVSGH